MLDFVTDLNNAGKNFTGQDQLQLFAGRLEQLVTGERTIEGLGPSLVDLHPKIKDQPIHIIYGDNKIPLAFLDAQGNEIGRIETAADGSYNFYVNQGGGGEAFGFNHNPADGSLSLEPADLGGVDVYPSSGDEGTISAGPAALTEQVLTLSRAAKKYLRGEGRTGQQNGEFIEARNEIVSLIRNELMTGSVTAVDQLLKDILQLGGTTGINDDVEDGAGVARIFDLLFETAQQGAPGVDIEQRLLDSLIRVAKDDAFRVEDIFIPGGGARVEWMIVDAEAGTTLWPELSNAYHVENISKNPHSPVLAAVAGDYGLSEIDAYYLSSVQKLGILSSDSERIRQISQMTDKDAQIEAAGLLFAETFGAAGTTAISEAITDPDKLFGVVKELVTERVVEKFTPVIGQVQTGLLIASVTSMMFDAAVGFYNLNSATDSTEAAEALWTLSGASYNLGSVAGEFLVEELIETGYDRGKGALGINSMTDLAATQAKRTFDSHVATAPPRLGTDGDGPAVEPNRRDETIGGVPVRIETTDNSASAEYTGDDGVVRTVTLDPGRDAVNQLTGMLVRNELEGQSLGGDQLTFFDGEAGERVFANGSFHFRRRLDDGSYVSEDLETNNPDTANSRARDRHEAGGFLGLDVPKTHFDEPLGGKYSVLFISPNENGQGSFSVEYTIHQQTHTIQLNGATTLPQAIAQAELRLSENALPGLEPAPVGDPLVIPPGADNPPGGNTGDLPPPPPVSPGPGSGGEERVTIAGQQVTFFPTDTGGSVVEYTKSDNTTDLLSLGASADPEAAFQTMLLAGHVPGLDLPTADLTLDGHKLTIVNGGRDQTNPGTDADPNFIYFVRTRGEDGSVSVQEVTGTSLAEAATSVRDMYVAGDLANVPLPDTNTDYTAEIDGLPEQVDPPDDGGTPKPEGNREPDAGIDDGNGTTVDPTTPSHPETEGDVNTPETDGSGDGGDGNGGTVPPVSTGGTPDNDGTDPDDLNRIEQIRQQITAIVQPQVQSGTLSSSIQDILDAPEFSIEVTDQAGTGALYNAATNTVWVTAELWTNGSVDDIRTSVLSQLWQASLQTDGQRIDGQGFVEIEGAYDGLTAPAKGLNEPSTVPHVTQPPASVTPPPPVVGSDDANFNLQLVNRVEFGSSTSVQGRIGKPPTQRYGLETTIDHSYRYQSDQTVLTNGFVQKANVLPQGFGLTRQAGLAGHDGNHLAFGGPVSNQIVDDASGDTLKTNSIVDEILVQSVLLGLLDYSENPVLPVNNIELTPTIQFMLRGMLSQVLPDASVQSIVGNNAAVEGARLNDVSALIPTDQTTQNPLMYTSINPADPSEFAFTYGGALADSYTREMSALFEQNPDIAQFLIDRYTHFLQLSDYNAGQVEDGTMVGEYEYVIPGHVLRPYLVAQRRALEPFAGISGIDQQIRFIDTLLERGDEAAGTVDATPPNTDDTPPDDTGNDLSEVDDGNSLDALFAELGVTDPDIRSEALVLQRQDVLTPDQLRYFVENAQSGNFTTAADGIIDILGVDPSTITVEQLREVAGAAATTGRIDSTLPQTHLQVDFLLSRDAILFDIVQQMFDVHQHGGGTICLDCNVTPGQTIRRAFGGGSYSDGNLGASFNAIIEATARGGNAAEGVSTFIFNVPQSVDSPPPDIDPIPYYLVSVPEGGGGTQNADGSVTLSPGGAQEVTPYYVDRSDPDNPSLFFPAVVSRTDPSEIIRFPMSIPVNAMPQLVVQSQREGGLKLNELTTYMLPSEVPYMGMRGLERDLKSIYQLFNDVDDANLAGLERISLGLVSGDPVSPDALESFKVAVSWVQYFEDQTELQLGGLGVGETTIAKEGVIPFLTDTIDLSNPEHMTNITNYIRGVGETGAAVILHADIGATPSTIAYQTDAQGNRIKDANGQDIPLSAIMMTTESDLANYERIKEVVGSSEAPVIWAHFGGVGRTQKPTFEHLQKVRDILEDPELSNVHIDMSWDIVSGYFRGNEALAQSAAQLIKDFPDRFMYGSDTVANDGTSHNALRDYLLAGVFDNLTYDEFALVMFGNARRVIGESSANVRQWMDANRDELQQLRLDNNVITANDALSIMQEQR
ncbi:amidohydrolase family protein [Aestuariibius insulae]|uniref:amidohydrolase family protein n=1 Tax=Aestuariibius insulae TaxID=2058287 RepID=UPI00398E3400